MGQYHSIVNLDAAQAINPHPLGTGLRLREQCASGYGSSTTALAMLLATESHGWSGDRIAVVGDYARPGDLPAGLPFADQPDAAHGLIDDESFTMSVRAMITSAFGITYSQTDWWADREIPARTRALASARDDHGFFVVNTDCGEYLDPEMLRCGRNFPAIALAERSVMAALMLLLSISGGAWLAPTHPARRAIGSWVGNRVSIDRIDVTGMADVSAPVATALRAW